MKNFGAAISGEQFRGSNFGGAMKRRYGFCFACMLAWVSVVFSIGSTAEARALPEAGTHDGVDADVIEAAALLAPGTDLESAIERLYREGARQGLAERVAASFPDIYAGWLYDMQSDTVTLRVSGEVPAELQVLASTAGFAVRFERVQYSAQRLTEVASRLDAVVGVVPGSGAKADMDDGAVAVALPEGREAEVQGAIATATWPGKGDVPVRFVASGQSQPEVCTDRAYWDGTAAATIRVDER